MREEQTRQEMTEPVIVNGGASANYKKPEKKEGFWKRVWNFIKSLFRL